jgi:hypothetical protein
MSNDGEPDMRKRLTNGNFLTLVKATMDGPVIKRLASP